ncbi:hypothetical protein E4K72_21940 [Oxalobacteraceae bacterium OM1]|nr:hypothetical protein E4K72_21940 [Oxalobacteraceae bacterium OM1]
MRQEEIGWTRRAAACLQAVWRLAMPFWMFRDVAHGSVEQRIANYRYNRERRKLLPFYVLKWIGISACLMQMMRVLSDFAATQADSPLCAVLFCMSAGIAFAFSCVVVAVLLCCYLFLTCVKR